MPESIALNLNQLPAYVLNSASTPNLNLVLAYIPDPALALNPNLVLSHILQRISIPAPS